MANEEACRSHLAMHRGGVTVAEVGSEIRRELGFKICDAFVQEAIVLAGADQTLLEALVVLGELSYVLRQAGVLGDDPLK
ncbi:MULTISPECIES: hypothetical protein [unclassified Streptomyces]|uniref:hypothetical protein n=1 Tax=unclassified Streptomyces TaxID=2593676 RepID=UPI0033A153F5